MKILAKYIFLNGRIHVLHKQKKKMKVDSLWKRKENQYQLVVGDIFSLLERILGVAMP